MITAERKKELRRNDYWRHREKRLSVHKQYRDRLKREQPWIRKFWSIKQRCTDPGCSCYKSYGAKGIKVLLTKDDLRKLWFRDKAYLMKLPSIDRIDNTGNYSFKNCRFIEMVENNRRKRKITQLDKVREFLLRHRAGSKEELNQYAKAKNITCRIADLRKEGMNIVHAYGRYILCPNSKPKY